MDQQITAVIVNRKEHKLKVSRTDVVPTQRASLFTHGTNQKNEVAAVCFPFGRIQAFRCRSRKFPCPQNVHSTFILALILMEAMAIETGSLVVKYKDSDNDPDQNFA